MLDYHRLKAFLAAAECLNFTQAAERLYVSQSSLSKMISQLEADLGFKLFIRTNRSVYLTREGQVIYEKMKKTVDDLDEALITAKRMSGNRAGSFTLSVSNSIGMPKEVIKAFHDFCDNEPAFSYELVSQEFSTFRQSLLNGQVDSVLVRDFDVSSLHGCESILLYEASPVVLVRAGHPAVGADGKLDLKKLAECEFVSIYSTSSISYYSFLHQCCDCLGFQPKVTKYVTNPEAKADNILLDDFAMVTDMLEAKLLGERVVYVKPENAKKIGIRLTWQKTNENPALQRFVEYISTLAPFEEK